MDTTHEEFYVVAFTLLTCEKAAMLQALDAFETRAREHFEQEDS
ncbi:hemerythrin domain-containing protein [Azohydromonas lata]|uniref:Uncharacterized protein n=1 Tax=Azohydromonas lata TaxID=45677 RepID=A0ABU5IEH7_9BURK|nr:hypothetical protein [Azohydromonas lata]MDZ5456920.1 hypothetical protein [Azohydromonas lata]